MNVVQDVARLVITRTDPRARAELTFMLDGTESRNSLPEPRGSALLQFLSRLEWNGDTLIVETTVPWVMTQRWSLTPSGQLSIQDVAPNIEVSVSTTICFTRGKSSASVDCLRRIRRRRLGHHGRNSESTSARSTSGTSRMGERGGGRLLDNRS